MAEDLKAMRELHRVLPPGGHLYMLQPVWLETGATVEDPSVTAPGERRKLFGQRDHVRIYGHDVIDRLESAGFDVRLEHYARRISREEIARHGLHDEPIFICRRRGS